MKIAFLSHFFPPTHISGAENYTYNIARALTERGNDVHVFCAGEWDHEDQYINDIVDETVDGISVRRVHLNWTKAPDPNRFLYDNPITGALFHDYLLNVQPDVVHITSCYSLSSAVIPIAKALGLPVVLTLVDFWFICPTLHLLRSDGRLCDGRTTAWDCHQCLLNGQKILRWSSRVLPDAALRPLLSAISHNPVLNSRRGFRGMVLDIDERKRLLVERLRQVDLVIAPSRIVLDIHKMLLPELPVRYQTHGHDLSWTVDLQVGVAEIKNDLRFCYIGQISRDKGVDVLIKAFRDLDTISFPARLDIWGSMDQDAGYSQQLMQISDGCERITFRGRFDRKELGHVLNHADVVVVPSVWYENNPLVIQEAFAAGKPVIASNLGGMKEFVQHERNGLLFLPADSVDLTRQMRRFMDHPDLMTQLQRGIPRVKTIEEEIDELLGVYNSLLVGVAGEGRVYSEA